MRKINVLMGLCIVCFFFFLPLHVFSETLIAKKNLTFVPDVDNQIFRNEIIKFVRSAATQQIASIPQQSLDELDTKWNNYYQTTDWSIRIVLYHHGLAVGEGYSHGTHLANTLKNATALSLNTHTTDQLRGTELGEYRFKVTFDYYPARLYSFIEFNDQGLELTGSRVAVRVLDIKSVEQQIQNSKAYLLRAMHPRLHGFFKFYNAAEDRQEDLLRTIYSSSSLYTFLKLYALKQDDKLQQLFKPIAAFILSNQIKEGTNAGAFYYGFDPTINKQKCKIVVGTASKTIFTLLEMNRMYKNDPVYLNSAKKAGDWLLSMVHDDGTVTPIGYCDQNNWRYKTKQSLLYSGQVLSALSRLYAVTQDKRYYNGAQKIATNFVNLINLKGPLVGDGYRPANSISTSWVMMSLIDFAKINHDAIYRNIIDKVARKILSRQITNTADIYSNGRYLDAMTTSGNGWINEVMGVFYEFCNHTHMQNCQQYKQAMLLTSRWLMQNAYTMENTYNVKNPQNAIGGFITNFTTQTVRTDAVCHGVNSLISLLTITGMRERILIDLPERPLQEVLPLLRVGNGFL